jgi:peroxiredoxin
MIEMATLPGMGMNIGQILPPVELPSTEGRLSLHRYRGRQPLVLLVGTAADGHEFECAAARLGHGYQRFQQAGAAVVGIMTGDEADARGLVTRQNIPFEIAWDESGIVAERLTPGLGTESGVTLYVTDRFLGVHLCVVGHNSAELPSPDRLAALVEGIERECPECGVAEDDWRAA